MKRFVLYILSILVILTTTACSNTKPMILFNKNQITVETVMDNDTVFKPGERIYYLILLPKKVKTHNIYIQVIKKGSAGRLGYELYWTHNARLKEEQMYYYDDYVVINQTGSYVMVVYSKDNPQKPLTMSPFIVSE